LKQRQLEEPVEAEPALLLLGLLVVPEALVVEVEQVLHLVLHSLLVLVSAELVQAQGTPEQQPLR
jgi:hypothetical protein